MDRLIHQAWNSFDISRSHPCLVQPSCPILWFGDLEAYRASPLKVVTVALNPSRKEFPQGNPYERFPRASGLSLNVMSREGRQVYAESLNEYFSVAPYRSWFGWFNEILIGMESSYYPGFGNTALHTDLCSPLATDPTWSGLGAQQVFFEKQGIPQWHQLVDELTPDVLILSIARRYLNLVEFIDPAQWSEFQTIQRHDPLKRPYTVYIQRPEGKPLVIFGQAAQQPFATLNKQTRRKIGNAIVAEIARMPG